MNFPADTPEVGGQNVQLIILGNTSSITDRGLMDGVVAQLEQIGIQAIPQAMSEGTQLTAAQGAGQFDWLLERNTGGELLAVVTNATQLAPVGLQTDINHHAGTDGTLDLLPYEVSMVEIVEKFIATDDAALRVELMKEYQKLYTENLDGIGLTQFAAALVVNKRFANVPVGTPNYLYNWGEDSIMRERSSFPPTSSRTTNCTPRRFPASRVLETAPCRSRKLGSSAPVDDPILASRRTVGPPSKILPSGAARSHVPCGATSSWRGLCCGPQRI